MSGMFEHGPQIPTGYVSHTDVIFSDVAEVIDPNAA